MAHLEEASALFRLRGDLAGQPLCQIVLAILLGGVGEHDRALALLHEAADLAGFGGFAWGAAAARYYEGEIRTDQGDYAAAAAAYRASIETSWQLGDPWTTGAGIGGVATVAALGGETESASQLFGIADALCEGTGAFLPVVDRSLYARIVATSRATLGNRVFAASYAKGRRLLPEDAVAEALRVAKRIAGSPDAAIPIVSLAPRERDIVRLLVEGRTDAEIAQALGVRRRTVSTRIADLLAKAGFANRTELAVYAVRHRLV